METLSLPVAKSVFAARPPLNSHSISMPFFLSNSLAAISVAVVCPNEGLSKDDIWTLGRS